MLNNNIELFILSSAYYKNLHKMHYTYYIRSYHLMADSNEVGWDGSGPNQNIRHTKAIVDIDGRTVQSTAAAEKVIIGT